MSYYRAIESQDTRAGDLTGGNRGDEQRGKEECKLDLHRPAPASRRELSLRVFVFISGVGSSIFFGGRRCEGASSSYSPFRGIRPIFRRGLEAIQS